MTIDISAPILLDSELLIPDPKNSRKHGEKNIASIRTSIKQFGQLEPLVVRKQNNVVLGGNARLDVMKELGFKEILITYVDCDEQEALAIGLVLNRSGELAEWDMEQLKDTLGEIGDDLFDMESLALTDMDFDFPDMESPDDGSADEVPEVPKNIHGVRRGEIWQLGDHRIMCGDSTDKSDVEKLISMGRPVFSFTSPPYVDMRDYGGGEDLTLDKIVQFIDKDACDFYAVNLGISRKDGAINPYWDEYIGRAQSEGLDLTSWNVWNREGMGGSIANMSAMFPVEHEWVFVFGGSKDRVRRTKKNKTAGLHTGISNRQKDGSTKRTDPKIVKEYGRMGSVITCCYATGTNKIGHPAMFPVELAENYINACSEKLEWIYEPFCGSGSTLIACENIKRRCYGMEIDEHYCSVIIERWQQFTGKQAVKIE